MVDATETPWYRDLISGEGAAAGVPARLRAVLEEVTLDVAIFQAMEQRSALSAARVREKAARNAAEAAERARRAAVGAAIGRRVAGVVVFLGLAVGFGILQSYLYVGIWGWGTTFVAILLGPGSLVAIYFAEDEWEVFLGGRPMLANVLWFVITVATFILASARYWAA